MWVVVVGVGTGGQVEEVSGGKGRQPRTNSIVPIDLSQHDVRRLRAKAAERKEKLGKLLVEVGPTLCWQDKDRLRQLLLSHHQAFAVEEGDRGETDLIQMTIDTGNASPCRQPVHRTPFAARTEVARQLREMQSRGVVDPSSRPVRWCWFARKMALCGSVLTIATSIS